MTAGTATAIELRKRLLEALTDAPTMSIPDLCHRTGAEYRAVGNAMRLLVQHGQVRRVRRGRYGLRTTGMIICYNRCLVCLRITPHEVCHEHSRALGNDWPDMVPTDELQEDGEPYYDWPPGTRERGWNLPAEKCDDTECAQLKSDWQ